MFILDFNLLKKSSILLITVLFSTIACTQVQDTTENIQAQIDSLDINTVENMISPFKNDSYKQYENKWVELSTGVFYTEQTAPDSAKMGDSKISILKFDPRVADIEFKSAIQNDRQALCVVDYADKFGYNIVINAGMYDLRTFYKSAGLLINDLDFTNNPLLKKGYNLIICANPKKKDLPNFDIIDLTKEPFSSIKHKYNSFAQGLRMIDDEGKPMSWNKNPMSCSQLIVAKDNNGMIYFVFTRSPYTHNFMINFMVGMGLKNAIYMEGGPQTSLFVDINNYRIEKLGSYASKTYAKNNNFEYWPLPNIIGIRLKDKKSLDTSSK